MLDQQGAARRLADPVEGVRFKADVLETGIVQRRIGGIHPLDPLDRHFAAAKDVADHRQARDEMPRAPRRHHDPGKPRPHRLRDEDVSGDRQSAKAVLGVVVGLIGMFVRHLDKTVVQIVAGDRRHAVRRRQHDARAAGAGWLVITLKEVVADDQMSAALHDGGAGKAGGAAAANLHIVLVDVQDNGGAVLGRNRLLVRQELAGVDDQPLTALIVRGDRAILRPVEHAIGQPEYAAGRGQHHAAGIAAAQDFKVYQLELGQIAKARKVEHVFVALKSMAARPRPADQGRRQIQRGGGDIAGGDIDLSPHAGAAHARADRDLRDVGHAGQPLGVRGGIGGGGGHAGGGPGRAGQHGQLAVADHPALGKAGQPGQGGHVDRRIQLDPAALQVQRHMVGEIEQRLKRLLEAQKLAAKGGGIGLKVIVAGAGQPRRIGHGQRALELDRVVEGQVRADEIAAGRHHHRAPRRCRIRRLERGAVVGHAVALGAIVAHIDPVEHLGMKDRGDILDRDVINPHHAAIRPGQVQAEMAKGGCCAPDHIHPLPVARADDGRNRHHRAIAGQRDRRPHLLRRRHIRPARGAGPTGNRHRGQGARHRLDLRRHPQIEARLARNVLKAAQLLRRRGLLQLQTAAEILIAGHKGGIALRQIRPLTRQAIFARPQVEAGRERRRHQDQTFGNRLVHLLAPSRCKTGASRPLFRAKALGCGG